MVLHELRKRSDYYNNNIIIVKEHSKYIITIIPPMRVTQCKIITNRQRLKGGPFTLGCMDPLVQPP